MTSPGSNSAVASNAAVKTIIAALLVFIAGITAIYRVTDGFSVVTTEDGRRLSIVENPRQMPDAPIQYETGGTQPLMQALAADGRVTIIAFMYTRCNAICSALGTEFQQLQETIRARGLSEHVRLLSVSFDREDNQARLAAYADRMQADPDNWRFARVADAARLQPLLDAFGITVIPAPLGEFQHNGAFHIVKPDGSLIRIVDYEQPEEALAYALAAAGVLRSAGASASGAGA